jgi:hypothetical protein
MMCKTVGETGDYHVECDKLSSENQISHIFTHMVNQDLKSIIIIVILGN